MKFSIKDFFSKCEQIRSYLRIWSHLLTKCLIENFITCAALDIGFQESYKIKSTFGCILEPLCKQRAVCDKQSAESHMSGTPKIFHRLTENMKY